MRVSLGVTPTIRIFSEFSENVDEVSKKVRAQHLSAVRGRGSVEDALALPKVMRVRAPGRRIALGVLSAIRVLANFLEF